MANTYGYIRVSSQDQNEDRQLIAMKGDEERVSWRLFLLPAPKEGDGR